MRDRNKASSAKIAAGSLADPLALLDGDGLLPAPEAARTLVCKDGISAGVTRTALIGSSPEILVRIRDGEVTIRPIAGTRPRGKTAEEDRANEASLLDDPKERAEHLMLLDLGRNDVGRVAQIGTVKVTDQMIVERYSHVMHIVSQVEGRIAADKTAFDLMRATFPAGTVSGAPKIRAMQIIARIEDCQRGFYSGALGYFGYDGNSDGLPG